MSEIDSILDIMEKMPEDDWKVQRKYLIDEISKDEYITLGLGIERKIVKKILKLFDIICNKYDSIDHHPDWEGQKKLLATLFEMLRAVESSSQEEIVE